MSVQINVSVGELWDKYTILLIKQGKISDARRRIVENEIAALEPLMRGFPYEHNLMFSKLKSVNERLWNIEDEIRAKEASKTFDGEFVELARQVYFTNDQRAEIKRAINDEFHSVIREVKCYSEYQ
jgi:hypothetical protein